MGLLKTPEREENLVSPQGTEALKDPSPFKDLMATLEKPADLTAHPGKESTMILFFSRSTFSNYTILILERIAYNSYLKFWNTYVFIMFSSF